MKAHVKLSALYVSALDGGDLPADLLPQRNYSGVYPDKFILTPNQRKKKTFRGIEVNFLSVLHLTMFPVSQIMKLK
jgi:hypothetical protein